jgi:hypothetical protein
MCTITYLPVLLLEKIELTAAQSYWKHCCHKHYFTKVLVNICKYLVGQILYSGVELLKHCIWYVQLNVHTHF